MATSLSRMNEDEEGDLDRQFVHDLYQECWDDFHRWDKTYCKQELKKLNRSLNTSGSQASVWDDLDDWETESEGKDAVESAGAVSTITVQMEYPLSPVTKMQAPLATLKLNFAPVPSYEYCRRVHQYLPSWKEKEELNQGTRALWLTFCPLVDDDEQLPDHRLRQFVELSWLSWEYENVYDNDVDIIEAEVVTRLLGMSFKPEQIDDLSLLPRYILDTDGPGVFSSWRSREQLIPPHWTAFRRPMARADKQQSQLEDYFHAWCNLCAEYECHTHPFSSTITLQRITRKGNLPERVEIPTMPCHPTDCVLSHPTTGLEDKDIHSSLTMLMDTYNILECTIPCKIAAIIDEPCWKVHIAMDQVFKSSTKIATTSSGLGVPMQTPNFGKWEPFGPCHHEGRPCMDETCTCVEIEGWCSSTCQCPSDCPRRPIGCKCKGACKSAESCICKRENRECQPGVCLTCKPQTERSKCTNNNIQRRRRANTEIRRAEHGWGLFALERIPKGGWIGPYVGELYSASTADVREIVANHLGRNYNFELTKEYHIDGTSCGNEIRFINDPRPYYLRVNCVVRMVWVEGDLYFGIETTKPIKTGEELYLNYGEKYWTDQAKIGV